MRQIENSELWDKDLRRGLVWEVHLIDGVNTRTVDAVLTEVASFPSKRDAY
jgi:hypothetical protein